MRCVILVGAVLLAIGVYCEDCKTVKCPPTPKHYEEFGCTPVIDTGKCCPSHFDCSFLKNRDSSKCYYGNQTFKIGDELHNADIEASCTIGCSCRGSDVRDPELLNVATKFDCTHIDCPEFFGSPKLPAGKKCIRQYAPKGCCSTNTVCGEDLNKLATCQFNDKTYYEGENIDTSRSCYSCVCGKGWENTPVEKNKHCHKVNCNMELHYYQKLLNNCVPIYWKSDNCCPIDWRCPDKETTVVPDSSRKNVEDKDDNLKCSFGELKMNVGDFLSPANDYDQCTICTCNFPPFPHCIKTC